MAFGFGVFTVTKAGLKMIRRILIIDDEPDICTLLASVLKTEGN
ncbi:MAG: hypothetical protein ACJATA_000696 [Sphingobacteriales bacterium]|jgi:hypothetical protein